jgi:hypothetical protein
MNLRQVHFGGVLHPAVGRIRDDVDVAVFEGLLEKLEGLSV